MGKKFSDLERASSLNNGDLFAVAQVDAQAQTGYKSKSAETSTIAQKLLKGIEFPTDLQTDDKTVIGAINEVAETLEGLYPIADASGPIANFSTELARPLEALKVGIVATQESGTPTPAAPLSISGWSEISVVNCGKNLFDEDTWFLANGYTKNEDGSYYKATNPLNVKLWENKTGYSGQISLSFQYKYDNATQIGFYPIVKYTDGTQSIAYTSPTTTFATRTLTSTSGKIVKDIVSSYGNNIGSTIKDFQIEVGSNVSAFEPYNGTTEVINLGGTYYGGHFTQDKDGHRQFVVDYVKRVLTDKTKWKTRTSSTYNYIYDDTITADRLTGDSTSYLMCNIFQVLTSSQSVDYCLWSGANTSLFAVQLNTISLQDLQDFTENYGVEICYKIATPIIIDLPDGVPIETLIGVNNIFADSGDILECKYKDTIQHYIDTQIAATQALIL